MGFAGRLKAFFGVSSLSPEFFEDLGDLLVEGDFGAAPAAALVDRLEEIAKKERIGEPDRLRERFVELLRNELVAAGSGGAPGEGPGVIILLGVNGVGKTTAAAKLAFRYREAGRRPILAAADTFRAGAIDQLKIHGERLGVRVVAHQSGGDPAAVVYDAAEAALSGGGDLVIADTAGRMHTKAALVEELKKINRVLETKLGAGAADSRALKWLVLDATTGRNALAQAEIFHQAVGVDGAILTKYDSGARGGIVFSLAAELGIPTVFICDGEGYEHIRPFDGPAFADDFVR
ncbi:MAG: signal recognition particle-docking protein FtsY [Treponema sp.]|nr:signal recognition particle-docking protein FtsY [Treponema sp.]